MIKQFFNKLKFWLKRGKNCSHCCLFCEYYDLCHKELTDDEKAIAKELQW